MSEDPPVGLIGRTGKVEGGVKKDEGTEAGDERSEDLAMIEGVIGNLSEEEGSEQGSGRSESKKERNESGSDGQKFGDAEDLPDEYEFQYETSSGNEDMITLGSSQEESGRVGAKQKEIIYDPHRTFGGEGLGSVIPVLATTPRIEIQKNLLGALPKFSRREDGPWGFINRFVTVCGRRKRQSGITEDVFRMAALPYCLTGDAAEWFKCLAPRSTRSW